MAVLICCDVCQRTLDGDAVALSFTKTARLADKSGEVRVVDSNDFEDYLLCERCAEYLERCALMRTEARSSP